MQTFHNVFISYGRRDSLEFAAKLNRHLVDHGFMVWFDFDNIPGGVDYQKQIDDGIERSDNVLFIISPHAVNSPYCLKEIELALKLNKRIIPLLHVERVSRETWQERHPTGTEAEWQEYQAQGLHDHFQNMHPGIRKINWVYFREDRDDFDTALSRLLSIFSLHKDYVQQHTRLLTKALEWEQQQRRSQFLLIGEERLQAEAWLKCRFQDSQPPCLPTDLHCELITESLKNAENLMTQVFLAYADEQRAAAQVIRKSLMREGFTVWLSSNDIRTGMDFQAAIHRGIEEADNLVYLMSPAFLQSEYCQQEIEYALSLHKRLVPILVEQVSPEQMPVALRPLHYIDLTANVLETDYQQDESQLIRVLRENAAYHEAHKISLAKALKWQRQHQNPTFLLRGYNLRHTQAWLKVAYQTPTHPPTALQEEFIAASLQQPPGISLDVFISYSRVDSGMARQLNEQLQIQGKRTWFDQESIAAGTADFQAEIHRGIESADHFLFILSPNSVTSPYCADEVEYAAQLNKRFVTILHRPIDTATLHPDLARVQWLDFSQPDRDDSANFQALLRILETDVEHLQNHTRLLVRAIEWETKVRNDSFLLRGDDLDEAEQWLSRGLAKQPKPTGLHQEYISISRNISNAVKQAQKILQDAREEAERLLQIAAVKLTSMESKAALLDNRGIDALLLSLRAVTQLKQIPGSNVGDVVKMEVSAVLQQAIDGAGYERNRLEGHQSGVRSANFSPDGTKIVTASYDNTARVWDTNGTLLTLLTGHQSGVRSVNFSPDGTKIVTASDDHTAWVWDTNGTFLTSLTGHQSGVRSAAFSPDGTKIVTASDDHTARVWDTNGTFLKELKGHQDKVLSAAFSPDGTKIVTASDDNTARVWDTNGTFLKSLKGHAATVFSAAFSPDGTKIVTASYDQTAGVWDTNGTLLKSLKGHQDIVWSATFSPDGTKIVTASADKTARVWDTNDTLRKELKGHQSGVYSAAFSSDGTKIVTASDDHTARVWDINGSKLVELKGDQASVWSAAFSPDGTKIVTASFDNTAWVWDTNGILLKSLKGHQDVVNSAAFSPDGTKIVTASDDYTGRVWDTSGNKLVELKGHQSWVHSAAFSPDGTKIVTASDDHTSRVWDTSGNKLVELKGHTASVSSAAFSPDGSKIVTSSADKTARVWDINGNKLVELKGHKASVYHAAFSPDGSKIVTASADNTARVWDTKGTLLVDLKGHKASVRSAAFSPDGTKIVTSSADHTARVWDTNGNKLVELKGHTASVSSAAFSPDGTKIVTASADKTARIWDSETNADCLFARGCEWLHDYLSTNPNATDNDRAMCGIARKQ